MLIENALVDGEPPKITVAHAEAQSLRPARVVEPLAGVECRRSLMSLRRTLYKYSSIGGSSNATVSGRTTLAVDALPPPSDGAGTFASLGAFIGGSAAARAVMSPSRAPLSMHRLLSAVRKRNKRSTRRVKPRRKLAQLKGITSRSENRARKALRTITIILGTFVVLWTP